MSLFVGLEHTDYQDFLRALGHLADASGWRDLRLVEHRRGLTIQARDAADLPRGFRLHQFTTDECLALLRNAYARRGTGRLEQPPAAGSGARAAPRFPPLDEAGYQGVLRAVGRLLDREDLRFIRLIERRHSLVVQGSHYGESLRRPATHHLTAADVYALLRETSGQRGSGESGQPPPPPTGT